MPLQFTKRPAAEPKTPEPTTAPDIESSKSGRGARRSSGRTLTHLATRVFNTPLAIHPKKGDVILGVLGARLGLDPSVIPVVSFDDEDDGDYGDGIGYTVQNGIALIKVHGTLVKRASGMDAMSGLTSYEQLTEQIEGALTDPDVKGILFDVDSPGGEAAGMSTLANMIYGARGIKPMTAVANDSAYSAAYGLACAADQIYLTVDAGVGSIGCYCLHCDQSGWDRQEGLKFTYIYAGDRKIDGNPHEPLGTDAKAELQAEVDRMRDVFVGMVARNRNIAVQNIFDLQAGCKYAQGAIPLLADKIGTLDDAMADMMNKLGLVNEAEPKDPDDPDQGSLEKPDGDDQEDPDVPWWDNAAATVGADGTIIITSSSNPDGGVITINGTAGDPPKPFTVTMPAKPASKKTATPIDIAKFGLVDMGKLNAHAKELGWADEVCEALPGKPIMAVRNFEKTQSSAAETGRRIAMLVVPYDGSMCQLGGGLKEVYQRGAFSQGLSQDPMVLHCHNEERVLGRQSAGTARFWEDQDGVHAEADAPDAQWASDLLVSIRRSDVRGASASFWILESHVEQRGQDRVRVIEKALLREASVHSFPAYSSTTAEVAPLSASAVTDIDTARLRMLRLR